jgi:hypothetical protein
LMLLALVGIGIIWYVRRKHERPMALVKPEQNDEA